MGVLASIFGVTSLLMVLSIAFTGSNPFVCTDANDCTSQAIVDIQDFDVCEGFLCWESDLLDVFLIIFIILGDVLALLSFTGLGMPEVFQVTIGLVVGLGWIVSIIGLSKGAIA